MRGTMTEGTHLEEERLESSLCFREVSMLFAFKKKKAPKHRESYF